MGLILKNTNNGTGRIRFYLNQPYVPPPTDPDATAFLTAAGITDPTISTAINTLVVDLKAQSLWTKMKAIYPIVGGTASTHKFNLKDPRDLDAAFRLQFFGGVTHNSNGITSNGTNAYADTFLNDLTHLGNDNKSISMYIRNVITVGSPMGVITSGGTVSNRFYPEFSGLDYSTLGLIQSGRSVAGLQKGFFTLSKSIPGSFKYYRPGTTTITVTGTNQSNLNANYYLLGSNNMGTTEFSLANLAFASIQESLNDTEEANFRTAVIAFETTLSRQV
jgi:hypothetical protein